MSTASQDLLRFIPDVNGLGANTSGTWELYFDGSDVGLEGGSENITGLDVLSDGSLVISTRGTFSAGGVAAEPQDILQFVPSQLGPDTAGTWTLLWDGSAQGLATIGEKIDGLSAGDDGFTFDVTTQGNFNVSGITGSDEDVLRLGTSSQLVVDSSELGLSVNDINAWERQTEPAGLVPPLPFSPPPPVRPFVVQTAVAPLARSGHHVPPSADQETAASVRTASFEVRQTTGPAGNRAAAFVARDVIFARLGTGGLGDRFERLAAAPSRALSDTVVDDLGRRK